MLKKILHQLIALPWTYNLLQTLFGVQRKKAILQDLLVFTNESAIILDVGGGTCLYKNIWPKNFQYICLDNDLVKLNGYTSDNKGDYKICGDAVQIPFYTNSIDYIFSSSMSHHVPEDFLDRMLCEMSRVLKPQGTLVFIDAVSIPQSPLNRFLWSLDRGEYPHNQKILENIISKYFHIKHLKTFSIYYDYLLIIATRKINPSMSN